MKRAEVDVGKFYEQVVETTVKSGRKKRTLSVRLRGDAVGSSSPTSRVAFCILIDLFMTRLLIVCSALARSYDDNCDVDRLGLAVLNALCRNPTVARTAASAAAMEQHDGGADDVFPTRRGASSSSASPVVSPARSSVSAPSLSSSALGLIQRDTVGCCTTPAEASVLRSNRFLHRQNTASTAPRLSVRRHDDVPLRRRNGTQYYDVYRDVLKTSQRRHFTTSWRRPCDVVTMYVRYWLLLL